MAGHLNAGNAIQKKDGEKESKGEVTQEKGGVGVYEKGQWGINGLVGPQRS